MSILYLTPPPLPAPLTQYCYDMRGMYTTHSIAAIFSLSAGAIVTRTLLGLRFKIFPLSISFEFWDYLEGAGSY